MKDKKPQPTTAELAILTILWEEGPQPVRVIHERLAAEKDVVYTTVLKTMQVMLERGFLGRESQGRKHIYHAAITKEKTQDSLLDTFVNRAFGGSAKKLAMRALGNYETSKEDLDELKALIEKIEKQQS
ncbi:BlaI/MecI/CopY family transcriptional regulator [Lewinella sp. 4G2]|uniref:BlaI/MecI/CopY family transcriptional regulator n=1 Tax=Lewinella sp. 4G2 TaxID=1803372 RepID=UPI0007B46CB4|nr:BlaI/MecI/CopY family transcriptional regulator [Lewinella sp. 4G2]OAV43765.1 transcriptional regulator [Lewinella sp. 4G2]